MPFLPPAKRAPSAGQGTRGNENQSNTEEGTDSTVTLSNANRAHYLLSQIAAEEAAINEVETEIQARQIDAAKELASRHARLSKLKAAAIECGPEITNDAIERAKLTLAALGELHGADEYRSTTLHGRKVGSVPKLERLDIELDYIQANDEHGNRIPAEFCVTFSHGSHLVELPSRDIPVLIDALTELQAVHQAVTA